MPSVNKKKIFNDPIYGFITLPYEIIFDLIERIIDLSTHTTFVNCSRRLA